MNLTPNADTQYTSHSRREQSPHTHLTSSIRKPPQCIARSTHAPREARPPRETFTLACISRKKLIKPPRKFPRSHARDNHTRDAAREKYNYNPHEVSFEFLSNIRDTFSIVPYCR